jgi:hypothetical protein
MFLPIPEPKEPVPEALLCDVIELLELMGYGLGQDGRGNLTVIPKEKK